MFSKGFSYLIDAVRKLVAEEFDIKLIVAGKIIGDDWMSEYKTSKLLHESISTRIDYVGSVYGKKKWELLKNAHVIALPTFYPTEAQPISLIEGMAFGCMPLTTDHNYNLDFIPQDIIALVKKQDADSIYSVLKDICIEKQIFSEKMQQSYEFASKHFRQSNYIKLIDRVISDVIRDEM
jgi:glycosyltransferase involved in cell wall biosynthesis